MLHNIDAKEYHCEYICRKPRLSRDYLLSFREDSILMRGQRPPVLAEAVTAAQTASLQYLFSISDTSFYRSSTPFSETKTLQYRSVQYLRRLTEPWLAFASVTGYHLDTWYRRNQYCGGCASILCHKDDERALVCPKCGQIIYPHIAPAVIVGIVHGEKLLLTKYSAGFNQSYALIAGFVEIGETLESAAQREVYEEVGLRIKNIRYYDNQPWGFSQSLLVGFFAELDGVPRITLETRELSEAVWVDRSDIPQSVSTLSLTSKMMEAFRLGQPV